LTSLLIYITNYFITKEVLSQCTNHIPALITKAHGSFKTAAHFYNITNVLDRFPVIPTL